MLILLWVLLWTIPGHLICLLKHGISGFEAGSKKRGKWYKETYDYHSLPLYREGKNEDKIVKYKITAYSLSLYRKGKNPTGTKN